MQQQDFNQLNSERENIKSLIKYLSEKLRSNPEPAVEKEILIQQEEATNRLQQVEDLLSQAGLPLFEHNTAKTYHNVSQEINALQSPDDLIEWVLYNSPTDAKNQIRKLRNNGNGLKSKVNGKWLGKSISDLGFYPSEFSLGIIQLENKVFGCGALLGSVYDKVWVRGLADEDEIRIEIYGENVPLVTFFHGEIQSNSSTTKIRGNYFINNGYDKGQISSDIEKELIQLSDKSNLLILLANFRDTIGDGELNEVRNFLETNQIQLGEAYRNEVILFIKKINDINKIKRLQINSFSEIQIEETKITMGILGLISEIERDLNQ